MDKKRRKWLEMTIATLEKQTLVLEKICKEGQEANDNLPESLQKSEKEQTKYWNIDALKSASSDLEDIISSLKEILKYQNTTTMKIQAKIAIASHLSDAQELLDLGHLKKANREINYAKAIFFKHPDTNEMVCEEELNAICHNVDNQFH